MGQRHFDVATRVQETLQRYEDLQDIIAILGIDELTEEDKVTVQREFDHLPEQTFFNVGGIDSDS